MHRALSAAVALALAAGTVAAHAEERQRLYAVGLDVVRLIDNGQFEPDDGTLNLFFQGYLTKNSAFTVGYAWGERSTIPEVTYKIYSQGYQSGSFWQIGLASVDVDQTTYDNDLAVLGAFGFEHIVADNLTVNTAVKAFVGIDHPMTGEKDIIFYPSLAVAFRF